MYLMLGSDYFLALLNAGVLGQQDMQGRALPVPMVSEQSRPRAPKVTSLCDVEPILLSAFSAMKAASDTGRAHDGVALGSARSEAHFLMNAVNR
jgi:hypothetical protein